MCRSKRKSYILLKLFLIFGYCGFTIGKSEGEEIPVQTGAVTSPTPSPPSSTQRSILVLKISPTFSGGGNSGSADGDEFIRNLNKRLEGYKKRISEYDTTNSGRNFGDSSMRNPHYPYEFPFKPPKEDLEYHTNAILYFIAISIVIVAIGVVSCLCINKSTCHKAVGEMTARANAASNIANNARGSPRRGGLAGANRGSRVNTNLSVISGTTTATSFSASPSVTNVNFSAGVGSPNSSPSSQYTYTNANFVDDGIHIKVMHDLPPSYESLFPPAAPITNSATAENSTLDANTISNANTTTVSASATTNENNTEIGKI